MTKKKRSNGKGFGSSDHEIVDLHNDAREIQEELDLPTSKTEAASMRPVSFTETKTISSPDPAAENDLVIPDTVSQETLGRYTASGTLDTLEFEKPRVSTPAQAKSAKWFSRLVSSDEYAGLRKFATVYLLFLAVALLFGGGTR